MTWDAYHRRGDVLRAVIDEANSRRDGVLPMEVPGVAETFGDELALVGALQLRWHTRLAGRIERALVEEPSDLEHAVLMAWRGTARELVGVREILDAYTEQPPSEELARALRITARKDWALLAAMAGQASAQDASAIAAGRRLEQKARAAYNPMHFAPRHRAAGEPRGASLLGRIKARLAA
jgi:hypothetical protein